MLVAGCVKFSAHWKATFQETQRHNIRYGGSREDGWADNDESIEKRRASHQSMNGSNRPTLQFLASNRTPLSTKHGCLVEYYIRGPWLKSYGTSVSWSKIVQLTPLENLLRQICIELCILLSSSVTAFSVNEIIFMMQSSTYSPSSEIWMD